MRMRLSVVFELLLVFLFLAFAAARVIDPVKTTKNLTKGSKKPTTLRQGPPNRYCACTSRMCNCCRDFSLPVVPLKGPGCASIMYVQKDTMMVTMSFGDRVLSNTTITGKTPKPVCMALPGGISQFCGRIYGISRKGDQFRACLGLELRALDDIEAALRVSCFKFGPKGVRLESAPPVPAESNNKDPEEEDDDDYDLDDDEDDDLIGFGVGEEDDEASSEDNEVDSDSVDYTGFSVLGEDLLGTLFSDDTGSTSTKKKNPNKKTAKPQVVIPKTSTTTRRPIFPNRKKSTVRPILTATKRPLVNRITRRPVSTTKPQAVRKPTQTVTAVPQSTVHIAHEPSSTSPVVNTNILEQVTKIKEPVTTAETLTTTMRVLTVTESQMNDKLFSEEPATTATEQSVTFTAPPSVQSDNVKNEIKLPLTDLEKLEAVAAIAQQDVSSGFISSGSLSSEETEKPPEVITVKYEKITPIILDSSTTYTAGNMEKINSVKFVPTTVVTSRPSAELADGDVLEELVNDEIIANSESSGVKKNLTNLLTTELTPSEEQSDESAENEEIPNSSKTEQNLVSTKSNVTVSLKKQPLKSKPEKEDEKEEEDEEEEEDLLEGVLSDEDESDNEEVEEESDTNSVSTNKDKNQATSNKEEEKEEEEDDDDDEEEDDILGEAEETSEEAKPTKVTIKKKPPKQSDQEDEEEEEEDILDVLADDVEGDDDEEEEEEDSEDDEDSGKPIKKQTTTQATTLRTKTPTPQATVRIKKPAPTTEKLVVSTTPEVKSTETVTEKVITYQKPNEQQTEKVIIYQGQEHKVPSAIFIYHEPENELSQKTTQKIIIYNEPVTEKFVVMKEEEKNPKPTVVSQAVTDRFVEVTKTDSSEEEKTQSGSDESEEDGGDEKQTLMASIIKPGFSNKYAEEHDLTENDDLEIEDTDSEDDNDFEEDRKLKQDQKQSTVKSSSKKPSVEVSKPKVLTLSDLIRQRKKYQEQRVETKPISTSRTHRRMNLDRLLQV